VPALDDPRRFGKTLGLVDDQNLRVAEGTQGIGGRQGGRDLESRLVDFNGGAQESEGA